MLLRVIEIQFIKRIIEKNYNFLNGILIVFDNNMYIMRIYVCLQDTDAACNTRILNTYNCIQIYNI